MNIKEELDKQAQDFLTRTNTKLIIAYKDWGIHFPDDTESRAIYWCQLRRDGKKYSFGFGQSIHNSNLGIAPTVYDVLSCLTKYDPGTFEDFCGDYGYDTDSRKAEKVYKAVLKEWAGVSRIFSPEELEELAEIN